jgi:hypothetical protein
MIRFFPKNWSWKVLPKVFKFFTALHKGVLKIYEKKCLFKICSMCLDLFQKHVLHFNLQHIVLGEYPISNNIKILVWVWSTVS